LELDVKQAELRAPLSGVVTSADVKVGEAVDPGKPVVEIAGQSGFRVELAVPSEDVDKLKLGMPVKVKLEAFDFQKYGTLDGTLEFISPDSTVIEGRAGAVYQVRVQVTGDTVGRGEWEGKIKLGMVGQVEMVTGEETVLNLLFKKIRQSVRLQ
jgi:multidrug resistance efflux pump